MLSFAIKDRRSAAASQSLERAQARSALRRRRVAWNRKIERRLPHFRPHPTGEFYAALDLAATRYILQITQGAKAA
jgi:hypothetical protein